MAASIPIRRPLRQSRYQLASAGIDCGRQDYATTPQAHALLGGSKDWRLLFQLDTDHGLKMQWQRDGRIYFWVRQEDARRGQFEDAWAVLQCI